MADSPDIQQPAVPSPDQQADTAAAGPQAPSAAAPDQAQPSATSVPAVGAPAAAPAAAAPAPQQTRMQQIEQGSKHVLGEIFQTLAGGKKAVWTQTPNGPVKTYEDLKPGEMARGILAAAITGLASGYDPANRGRGPAMSSAFSAGFKGEEEAKDKKASAAQKEAQEQFINKNASDELLMKKQRFATEQQQSMLDYTKTQQMMDQSATRAKQEGIVFDQGQRAYFDGLDAKYTGEIAKGGKPIDDPKNPGQPLVFWDKQTLQQYANEHGKELVAPGEFDTKIMSRPDGSYVIMKTPLAEREKRSWRFAQMDPKNPTQPLMKDGKVVPSGQKDQSGQVIAPAIMSGEDYGNKVTELDAHKKAAATAEDLYSQAIERRAIAAKDAKYMAAQDQLGRANGDINAMDIENGKSIVSDPNRGMMISRLTMETKDLEAAWRKADTEFGNLPPSEQTPEKRDQIEEMKNQYNFAKSKLAQASTAEITTADKMTASLLKKIKDPEDAAKFFDQHAKEGKYAASLLPQEIDAVRKNLIAANQQKQQKQTEKTPATQDLGPSSSSKDFFGDDGGAKIKSAQDIMAKQLVSGASSDAVQASIKANSTFSVNDKKKLLSLLPTIIPYKVTQQGSTITVPVDQIADYLKNNPNAQLTAADQSRYKQQQQQEEEQQKEAESVSLPM